MAINKNYVALSGIIIITALAYLPMLQNLTFLTTLGAPLLCLLLFWRFRDRMNAAFFGIATLKITLVLFFNLLIIPVPNIFYTSGFLSLAILAFYTQDRV